MMSRTYRKLHAQAYKAATDQPLEFDKHMRTLLMELYDPNVRSAILTEAQIRMARVRDAMHNGKDDPYRGLVSTLCPFSNIYPWTPNCEPEPATSVREVAKREGCKP